MESTTVTTEFTQEQYQLLVQIMNSQIQVPMSVARVIADIQDKLKLAETLGDTKRSTKA